MYKGQTKELMNVCFVIIPVGIQCIFSRDLLKYLTQNTGMEVSTVWAAENIYDTLSIEDEYNKV